jgi:membrane associated rhomboid family serine protease
MLFIPVGQVDNTVRRNPWVSYFLIAANLLVTIATTLVFSDVRQSRELKNLVNGICQELVDRPYLSIPPQVEAVLNDEFLRQLAEHRIEWRKTGTFPAAEVGEREQADLETRASRVAAILDGRPARRFGYTPARPAIPNMFTYAFLHAGWIHLLGNLLFLFVTGPFLEDVYGRTLFALLYLASAAAACNVQALAMPTSTAAIIGASGAVAGVMGAFLVRLAAARIRFLLLPIPIIPVIRIPVIVPAFVVMPLWLGEQFFYARYSGEEMGVAWWAHIGGFSFGVAVALLVKLTRVEEIWINPGIERHIGLTLRPTLESAIDARARGDLVTARRELRKALAEEPQNVDAWAEAYEQALASKATQEIPDLVLRLLGMYEKLGEVGLASVLLDEHRWEAVAEMPVRFQMDLATYLERTGDKRAALGYYETVVRRAPADLVALRGLLRIAEICRGSGNLRAARAACETARRHPSCTGTWLALVEKATAAIPADVPRPPEALAAEQVEYQDRTGEE